jgi:hypothetical protein
VVGFVNGTATVVLFSPVRAIRTMPTTTEGTGSTSGDGLGSTVGTPASGLAAEVGAPDVGAADDGVLHVGQSPLVTPGDD